MRTMKFLLTAALVVAVLPFSMVGKTDATADARKEITADYAKADAAAAKKDVAGIYTYYSPDYVGIDEHGKQKTLKEEIQEGKQVIGMIQALKVKTVIQQFSLKGKDAVVTVKQHVDISATDPTTQKTVQDTIDQSSKDSWHKTSKGWRLMKSKTLTSTSTPPTPQ